MSDGKNIELKIVTTGGDAAAAEVRKPGTAAAESAKAMEDLGNKTSAAAPTLRASRLKEIAVGTGAIGIAAKAAGETLGQVKEAFESIDTVKLRGIDAEMATQIEKAKDWSNALSDPIGALLKFTTGETVGSAFAGLNEQIALTAKSQAEAIDLIIKKGIKQADELKKLTDAIKAANAILDARDKADAAERDNKDAEDIRNGAAPEDVEAQRAKDEAAKEIERINRGLDPKAAEVQTDYENEQTAKGNAERIRNTPGAKPDDQRKADEAARLAQEKFEQSKRDFETAKAVAEQERRAVRAQAKGKVSESVSQKADRLKEEEEKRQEAAFEARKNFNDYQDYRSKESDAGARKKEAEKRKDAGAAGRAGRSAEKLVPDNAPAAARKKIEEISDGLQDGDQGGEMERLLAVVEQLAKFVKAKGDGKGNGRDLSRRIEILEQQIRSK